MVKHCMEKLHNVIFYRRQDTWVVASLLRPKDFQFHPDEPSMAAPPGPDEIHKREKSLDIFLYSSILFSIIT